MRDFRDAKAMATSLRQALSDKSVTLTHSESLELVAKSFGLDNWNILAAKIDAERPAPAPGETPDVRPEVRYPPVEGGKTIYCSFCGKPQQDVLTIIAGPSVFICNECVGLCEGIVADAKLKAELAAARARQPEAPALETAADVLRAYGDNQLEATRKSNADWLEHIDWSLDQIGAALAGQPRAPWRPDDTAVRRGWTRDPLEGMSHEKIVAQQAHLQEIRVGIRERERLISQVLRERAEA
jgi:hypothetical protein